MGGNFIDTADVYADGVSEEIVGEWLRSRPQEITREVVLATKGHFPTSALGASRRHLRRALTESLRRLRSITSTSTSCTHGILSPRSRKPWTSWTGPRAPSRSRLSQHVNARERLSRNPRHPKARPRPRSPWFRHD
ncbi:aldo/keto reductase, partial [Arachnia propionica]|uniref:aldo/keto reductase n=1 Tax=Arachnia propionica TaxID=1750 RepID=UPI003C6F79D2